MKLKLILKDFGLTERQVNIYLNTMELGSISAYKIAKKLNIPRSTCYEELDNLRDMRLITTFRKKKVKYYSAEDPRKFLQEHKGKIEMLEKSMPEFSALFMKQRNKPQVRFYEKVNGMKIIFQEILNDNPREMLGFSSADDIFEHLNEFWPDFVKKRKRNKIPIRLLMKNTAKGRERQANGREDLRTVRLLPKEYQFNGVFVVWKNKIAMFSFSPEMIALIIESPIIYKTQKAMFDIIWASLK